MGILDFLKAAPQTHPTFGQLQHRGGKWRGSTTLDGKALAIFLPGSRGGPDPAGVKTADEISDWWARARWSVERELFEHYSAGKEAEIPDLPDIASAAGVWQHVKLSSVEVRPYDSTDEIQVAISASWDEEHTLGALIRNGDFVDLNGSILEPR
jgi:hypothetical protein